jgi:hypothetical protein
VANFLAALNYDAHLKTTDGTVGPRCIVVWRDREKSGADYYFTGKEQEMNAPSLPGIVTGIDMKSMSKVLQDYFQSLDWKSGSEIKIDVDALNAKLKQVPSDPNEKLH